MLPRLAAFLVAGASVMALAQPLGGPDVAEAWRASREAIGRQVAGHTLLDRQERPLRLEDLRGKPLLVSFIYTGCFHVCPTATRELDKAVGEMQERFGKDAFRVVSIGFNPPADSPQSMKAFALQHRIARPNWDFLSVAPAAVPELAANFGFRFSATAAGFDHVLQVSVLDAQGRIVRQVYGGSNTSPELAEAVRRLTAGETVEPPGAFASLVEEIRILCTVYDPETGTYRVNSSLVLELAGGFTFILFMALYMLDEWWKRRRERRNARRIEIG